MQPTNEDNTQLETDNSAHNQENKAKSKDHSIDTDTTGDGSHFPVTEQDFDDELGIKDDQKAIEHSVNVVKLFFLSIIEFIKAISHLIESLSKKIWRIFVWIYKLIAKILPCFKPLFSLLWKLWIFVLTVLVWILSFGTHTLIKNQKNKISSQVQETSSTPNCQTEETTSTNE